MSECLQPDSAGPMSCNVLYRTFPGQILEVAFGIVVCLGASLYTLNLFLPLTSNILIPLWLQAALWVPAFILLFPFLCRRGELRVDSATGSIEMRDSLERIAFSVSLVDVKRAYFHTRRGRVECVDLSLPGGTARFWSDIEFGAFPNELIGSLNPKVIGTTSRGLPSCWWFIRFCSVMVILPGIGAGFYLLMHPVSEGHVPWDTAFGLFNMIDMGILLLTSLVYAFNQKSRGARLLGFSRPGAKQWILRVLTVTAVLLVTGGLLRAALT